MKQDAHSRNPAGLVKDEQIPLRLMRNELDDAERIAKEHRLSKSNVARRAYRLGLPLLKDELAKGAPKSSSDDSSAPATGPSAGGESSLIPAASFSKPKRKGKTSHA